MSDESQSSSSPAPLQPIRGRGAAVNPANRFDPRSREHFADDGVAPELSSKTEIISDTSATIITYNNSPDVGFDASINLYRGCEHGCAYCFARPTHEYLGFSSGLEFETKIVVKYNGPELLRKELSKKNWVPQPLAMSGVTDCYQPLEKKLGLTRRCLEVLLDFRNPVIIITKNHLITRDIDLLAELAKFKCTSVYVSITTLDPKLTPILEPRASLPRFRLDAVSQLSQAGVPVGVLAAPMIPAINNHELPRIIEAAAAAGARYCGYVPIRLPYAVKSIFVQWLEDHFPDRKEKVIGQIQALRGGKLNDANFGSRMKGEGFVADQMQQAFNVAARRAGLLGASPDLSTEHFRRPGEQQQLDLLP
jgi:DNA repair photolyase